MPQKSSSRTSSRARTHSLPDDLKLGTALLAGFRDRGLLASVQDWLPLSRRAGHGTAAMFAFSVAYLAAGRKWGVRPFALTFATALTRLVAPLVGLRALPSAASVSRALGRLRHADVRRCVDRLLTADSGIRALLDSPHVRHRDARGRDVHVLDVDPTIEAFRQRSLPSDPSLPEGERLAPGTPGYTGHKRGEIRIRHLPLQHAGSALWLAYRLDATGGSLLPLLTEMIGVAREVLDRCSPADIVVRADGEFGSVGAMRTCIKAGVGVLTRLRRPTLVDREDVAAALASAQWYDVPSDGSGPRRQAADLGLFTLYPDADAEGADEGPVEVRVVASRFPRSSPPDHGVLRNGFQIELFATTLDYEGWPPAAVVALYFGRGAMENRFAQEDREIGIDRTFSYNPAGQEWMSGIGLFLWNVLIGRGVAAEPLPAEVPAQVRRTDEAPVAPVAPASEPLAPLCVEVTAPSVADEALSASEPDSEPAPETAVHADPPTPCVNEEATLRSELWAIARRVFDARPPPDGWKLDDERAELRCPNGKRLFVCAAESERVPASAGRTRTKHQILVRTEIGVCNGCPFRAECTSSERPGTYKQLKRSIPEHDVLRARELLLSLKTFSRKAQVRRALQRRHAARPPAAPAPVPLRPLRVAPPEVSVGPYVPAAPLFLPAASRHSVRRALDTVTVEVTVVPGIRTRRTTHPLLAASQEARRHQRLSWSDRAERWRHGGTAILHLDGQRRLSAHQRLRIVALYALNVE